MSPEWKTKEYNRRQFLTLGIGGVVSVILAIPLVGYLFDVLFRPTSVQWVPVCTLDQLNAETPIEFTVTFQGQNASINYADVRGIFLIRQGSGVLAFSNICTHMNCSVRWLGYRQQILCPCHGGTYDRYGNLAGGPPPYGLPYVPVQIQGNQVLVSNQLIPRG